MGMNVLEVAEVAVDFGADAGWITVDRVNLRVAVRPWLLNPVGLNQVLGSHHSNFRFHRGRIFDFLFADDAAGIRRGGRKNRWSSNRNVGRNGRDCGGICFRLSRRRRNGGGLLLVVVDPRSHELSKKDILKEKKTEQDYYSILEYKRDLGDIIHFYI